MVSLTSQQVIELKSTSDKLEDIRVFAMLNMHNGITARKIANSLHVTIVTIFNSTEDTREGRIE